MILTGMTLRPYSRRVEDASLFLRSLVGVWKRLGYIIISRVESLGINAKRLTSIMFAISIMLGGIAGAMYSPVSGLSPKEGLSVFGNVMPILMIGGIRNMKGAIPAALVVGLVNAFGAIFVPSIYGLLPFLLMVIVMIIKPAGLFTPQEK